MQDRITRLSCLLTGAGGALVFRMPEASNLVLMAEIVGVHGVKGTVKLKIFSEDPRSLAGTQFYDSSARPSFAVARIAAHGNIWLADLDGITDRTAAERLRGNKLYLLRSGLPKITKKDTFYHADLIDMTARHVGGDVLGKVVAVANFGAGDLLDIKPEKGNSFYVPFTSAFVPHVDTGKKELTVDPPEGLIS